MEEGEGEGLEKVVIMNDSNAQKKNVPQAPPLPGPIPPPHMQEPEQTPVIEE